MPYALKFTVASCQFLCKANKFFFFASVFRLPSLRFRLTVSPSLSLSVVRCNSNWSDLLFISIFIVVRFKFYCYCCFARFFFRFADVCAMCLCVLARMCAIWRLKRLSIGKRKITLGRGQRNSVETCKRTLFSSKQSIVRKLSSSKRFSNTRQAAAYRKCRLWQERLCWIVRCVNVFVCAFSLSLSLDKCEALRVHILHKVENFSPKMKYKNSLFVYLKIEFLSLASFVHSFSFAYSVRSIRLDSKCVYMSSSNEYRICVCALAAEMTECLCGWALCARVRRGKCVWTFSQNHFRTFKSNKSYNLLPL